MHGSRAKAVWKGLAILGVGLLAIGLGAFGLDLATKGQFFDSLSGWYEPFFFAIPVGLALLLVGLIGWAAVLDKTGRTRIAFFALILPFDVILIGFALGGTHLLGPFIFLLLPMAPLILVGLVVAIMAASARRTETRRTARSYTAFVYVSGALIIFTVILAGRMVWEETSQSWTPRDADIAKLEAGIKLNTLPGWTERLPPLSGYARYYATSTMHDEQLIVGELVVPVWSDYKPGIHIVGNELYFPIIADGGCAVISLVYSLKQQKMVSIRCNGVA